MKRPIRVLIATPAGGGVVTTHYFLSFLATWDRLNREAKKEIELGLYTLANESLISRGRNHCAAVALYQKWDKLLFIDADQGWTYEQFRAIVLSDKPIIGAVSPLKILPIHLNYLPKKEDEHYHQDRARSPEGLRAMRAGRGTPEINVGYIGTGFLCIDVAKTLMPLTEIAEPYRYPDPSTGQNRTEWEIFDTSPINRECMSEDWGFIHKARSIGIEPWINADCTISHTGHYTFRVSDEQYPSQQGSYESRPK